MGTHLNPVNVSRKTNPSFSAIERSIFDDTVEAHIASLSVDPSSQHDSLGQTGLRRLWMRTKARSPIGSPLFLYRTRAA